MPTQISDPQEGRLTDVAGWDGFFDGVEALVRDCGAEALSLGVVQDDRIHTYNVGFAARTSALYASIAVQAPLPGPVASATRSPQYFSDGLEARSRYPLTATILEDSPYEAAACLPLVTRSGEGLGYLALHYVGRRSFSAPRHWVRLKPGRRLSTAKRCF